MKILEFGQKPKRWLELVICSVIVVAISWAGLSMFGSPAQAGDEKGSPKEEPPLNDWSRAFDWDGTGEQPFSYQIGGIARSETLPEEYVLKKLLRDLPVGMGGWVRSDALKIDATRHGWLRADALVCTRFAAHEFVHYVTRWEGGYYVRLSCGFVEGKGTYKVKDGFIPVKAFCRPEAGMHGFVIQLRDPESKDNIYKGPDPAADYGFR